MKEKFLTFYKGLKPNQKGIVVMLGIGVFLTFVGLAAYFSNSKKMHKAKPAVKQENQVIAVDDGLLKKNELLEAQKEAQVAKDALKDKELQDEDAKKAAMAAGLAPPPAFPGSVTKFGQIPPPQKQSAAQLPPPPMPRSSSTAASSMPANMPPPAVPQPMVSESEIGGIYSAERYERKSNEASVKDDKKKEEKRSVYLPISYMEATLLSGLDAPTSADAKGNPVPVLIRVKTPAVLPNDVKANLRGCFVVADGKGNLGTERAELVLVSLSCIDRKGRSVIDQSLTGYVVDADGKAGLRGRVVTKMGAMISRSMIAGLFGGFGEALKEANTTTSLSSIGSLSSVKPSDVGWTGLGKGLSNAFTEIQKFYLELAHQTMPVVEVGAARPITLVLTKGVNLDIKKIRGMR